MHRFRPAAKASICLAPCLALLLAACAHGPEPVHLLAPPQPGPADVGRGRPVAVQVVDARAGGGDMPSSVQARAEYPLQGDPVATVRKGVLDGLLQLGFIPGGGTGPSLTVEVQRFDYWVLKGFGTSDVRATAVLTAVARRGTASLEITYKADQHQKVAIVPRRVDVEDTVNGALATVLKQLFTDDKLMAFLAGD